MTQYVFTLTSRMVAIACACIVALGLLLFLLGVEIGKLWVDGSSSVKPTSVSSYSHPSDSAETTASKSDASGEQGEKP